MAATPSGRADGPRTRFEVGAWYMMRITGAVLLIVAVFHLMLMHVFIGVDRIDYSVIIGRWASPFWRIYDLVLLAFALVHGANGARWVIDDYIHPRRWNMAVKVIVHVIILILFLMGAQVVFTYEPAGSAAAAVLSAL